MDWFNHVFTLKMHLISLELCANLTPRYNLTFPPQLRKIIWLTLWCLLRIGCNDLCKTYAAAKIPDSSAKTCDNPLTSAHSVDPVRLYSSASQLATIMFLRGRQPEANVIVLLNSFYDIFTRYSQVHYSSTVLKIIWGYL